MYKKNGFIKSAKNYGSVWRTVDLVAFLVIMIGAIPSHDVIASNNWGKSSFKKFFRLRGNRVAPINAECNQPNTLVGSTEENKNTPSINGRSSIEKSYRKSEALEKKYLKIAKEAFEYYENEKKRLDNGEIYKIEPYNVSKKYSNSSKECVADSEIIVDGNEFYQKVQDNCKDDGLFYCMVSVRQAINKLLSNNKNMSINGAIGVINEYLNCANDKLLEIAKANVFRSDDNELKKPVEKAGVYILSAFALMNGVVHSDLSQDETSFNEAQEKTFTAIAVLMDSCDRVWDLAQSVIDEETTPENMLAISEYVKERVEVDSQNVDSAVESIKRIVFPKDSEFENDYTIFSIQVLDLLQLVKNEIIRTKEDIILINENK